MGILLVQPVRNAAHEFGNIVTTRILRAILELMTLKDRHMVNVVLHTYFAIKLLGIFWLSLVDLLLEIGDKPSKFLQRICAAGITVGHYYKMQQTRHEARTLPSLDLCDLIFAKTVKFRFGKLSTLAKLMLIGVCHQQLYWLK
jgi:hypothetical protein